MHGDGPGGSNGSLVHGAGEVGASKHPHFTFSTKEARYDGWFQPLQCSKWCKSMGDGSWSTDGAASKWWSSSSAPENGVKEAMYLGLFPR
jgi:hypothetical protein